MDVPHLQPCIPVPLEEKKFKELVDKSKDWALMHGVALRFKTNFNPDSVNFLPFTLFPSTFPREEFEKAVYVQTILNELIHNVAHDHEFLSENLKSTIKADEFTRRLYEIYETVRKEGFTQEVSLGLLRCDYLLNYSDNVTIKQVEINTIAVASAGVSPQLACLHRMVLRELGRFDLLKHLLENNALTGLCKGLTTAWSTYNNPKAAILFVAEREIYNICDQRFHEFKIKDIDPNVTVITRTFIEIQENGVLDDKKNLFVDGIEIAVVYFRSGFDPGHYKGEKQWEARLLIERSSAIKCPSIHYHLAGTKKIQQALARPQAIERFLKDPKKVDQVREIFTGLYSLDFDNYGDEAVELALRDPEKYVLKPQREGGGNNVYGLDVKTKIEEMKNSIERTAWILMERIVPPVQLSYLIMPGVERKAEELQEIVSELGIFGVILGDANKILLNQQVGHNLRSKLRSINEGGFVAGRGCLDTPFLID